MIHELPAKLSELQIITYDDEQLTYDADDDDLDDDDLDDESFARRQATLFRQASPTSFNLGTHASKTSLRWGGEDKIPLFIQTEAAGAQMEQLMGRRRYKDTDFDVVFNDGSRGIIHTTIEQTTKRNHFLLHFKSQEDSKTYNKIGYDAFKAMMFEFRLPQGIRFGDAFLSPFSFADALFLFHVFLFITEIVAWGMAGCNLITISMVMIQVFITSLHFGAAHFPMKTVYFFEEQACNTNAKRNFTRKILTTSWVVTSGAIATSIAYTHRVIGITYAEEWVLNFLALVMVVASVHCGTTLTMAMENHVWAVVTYLVSLFGVNLAQRWMIVLRTCGLEATGVMEELLFTVVFLVCFAIVLVFYGNASLSGNVVAEARFQWTFFNMASILVCFLCIWESTHGFIPQTE